jgi:hypothetical protein
MAVNSASVNLMTISIALLLPFGGAGMGFVFGEGRRYPLDRSAVGLSLEPPRLQRRVRLVVEANAVSAHAYSSRRGRI